MRTQLVRQGIRCGDRVVPLLVGSAHYWRLDRADWRPCLEALKSLNVTAVDTYVPWAVHELDPNTLDLGQVDPRKDIGAFLELIHELELLAIVRPGPHINAELTYFGIPERVIWDSDCQARTPGGNPVMLPVLPKMFPVPSYASSAYRDEVAKYFEKIAPVLGRYRYPEGPVVMAQVDNEGALFFRDGAYDQDHHPDAVSRYREFLRERYGTTSAMEAAYGATLRGLLRDPSRRTQEKGNVASSRSGPSAELHAGPSSEPNNQEAALLTPRFSNVWPPSKLEATTFAELQYVLDWTEFQEDLLADSLREFASRLRQHGLDGIPLMHNFPLAQEATPLNASKLKGSIDLIAYDYYNRASASDREGIARRTSELAVRCAAADTSPYGAEVGGGYPPYFPPLAEADSEFTILTALAYGLRGFNIYMAVERDRWIGSPIDRRGNRRPFADFWETLNTTLLDTDFADLRRRVPVRIVVPRIERRIARVMHAFGPASGALFSVSGKGPRESCFEDHLDVGFPVAIAVDNFVRAFELALSLRGVPFAHVNGEDCPALGGGSLEDAQWVVVATGGHVDRDLEVALKVACEQGASVTVGPQPAVERAAEATAAHPGYELVESLDPATIDKLVARHVEFDQLPTLAADPDAVQATIHETAEGQPAVVFLVNASGDDLVARVTLGFDGALRDAFDGSVVTTEKGVLEARVLPKRVRMLVVTDLESA